VTNRIADYLKLHLEETAEPPHADQLPEFDRLCSLFPAVTGLRLCIDQHTSSNQLTFPWSDQEIVSYSVSLEPTQGAKPSLQHRRELEEVFSALLNTLSRTRHELRYREAELAAAVPVVSVDDDGAHLAERLEAVLSGTANMLQCYAAGLYLLDEATTSLKLRAQVGLGPKALLLPPRRLEDAIADIEALAGHAVVIDDTTSLSHWNVPEESESAICVPISSATTILGTVWMYRDIQSDFTPTEQNLAEITAGRLAADLERAVLIQEVRSLRGKQPPKKDAEDWNESHPAKVPPCVDGWEVVDVRTKGGSASDFCHWHLAGEDRLHLGVGAAHGFTDKQMSRVVFQTVHAAHTQHDLRVGEILDRVNQSLWTSSIEGAASSLFHALLDPTCGSLEYALAGSIFAYVLRPHGWEPLLAAPGLLGTDSEIKVQVHQQALMPGDILVVINGADPKRGFEEDTRMNHLAEKLLRNTHLSARELSKTATTALEKSSSTSEESFSVLVAKRDE